MLIQLSIKQQKMYLHTASPLQNHFTAPIFEATWLANQRNIAYVLTWPHHMVSTIDLSDHAGVGQFMLKMQCNFEMKLSLNLIIWWYFITPLNSSKC